MNVSSAPGLSAYLPQQAAGLLATAPSWPKTPSLSTPSLSDAGLMSAQRLSERVDALQSGTAQMAQNFLGSFAQQIFGQDAKGVSFSFDSLSVSAESRFAAGARSTSGPDGSSSAAAMRLEDAASFSGRGTMTTADGRSFSFEIEVRYEARMEASMARTSSRSLDGVDKGGATGTVDAADEPMQRDFTIDFPGTVADLFRLFNQNMLEAAFELPAMEDANQGEPRQGKLSLRLLDLLQQPDSRDPREKKLADAYQDVTPANIIDEMI